MEDGRSLRWEGDTLYTEEQVAGVLRSLGISIESETEAVYLTYCPFHSNRDTPSFAVNKMEGLYICYNPSCNRTGNLMMLVKFVGNMDDFKAKRLIARNKHKINIEEQLQRVTEEKLVFAPYVHRDNKGIIVPDYMQRVKEDMWRYADPQLYMKGRGFEKQTLKDFEIGYDLEKDYICVPMHDPSGMIEVGAVRRSIKGKVFDNTRGLPSSKTLFNLHRAKRTGDVCIVVEASFSSMRLHQCGYPNAVSVLMGHFNEKHASLLGRYFNTIVIMTDFDKKQIYPNCPKCRRSGSNLCVGHNPGEELGNKIADMMSTKKIMWAHCGGPNRFPPDMKDPDDMDDEMIRHCVKNAVSHLEYALDL